MKRILKKQQNCRESDVHELLLHAADLMRWEPKTISDFLDADKTELAKQVAAWLCERVSEGREYAVPPLMKKVLMTLPGYEEELKAMHDSGRADKEERLHYLRKRFRFKCEVLLARAELVELVGQLKQPGASNG